MENYKNDTIAAIATALSDSGIGIIRISGDDAIYIVDSIFRSPSGKRILTKVQSHTVHYGYIVDKEENVIDEVMVVVMKAPKSYTTEDTVEINCHGGVLVVQKVLQTVLENGARISEPGEFTKRAFLNGRIDLSRAEAVIDVIHSQNEYALSSSVSQLKGRLSDKIHKLREDILYQIAFIESALDDPEHISLDGYPELHCAQALIILPDKLDNVISANLRVWHGFVYDMLQNLFCQLRNGIPDVFLPQKLLKLPDERICDVTQVACVASGNQCHVVIKVRCHRENRTCLAGAEQTVVLRMAVNIEYQRVHKQNVQIGLQERRIQILQDIIVEVIVLIVLHQICHRLEIQPAICEIR